MPELPEEQQALEIRASRPVSDISQRATGEYQHLPDNVVRAVRERPSSSNTSTFTPRARVQAFGNADDPASWSRIGAAGERFVSLCHKS